MRYEGPGPLGLNFLEWESIGFLQMYLLIANIKKVNRSVVKIDALRNKHIFPKVNFC